MTLSIQHQAPEVVAMAQHWPVTDALLGGTHAMRAAGETYLPMETREDPNDYKRRLATATLFPAFRRTLGVMSGKPFSKALTYGQTVPDVIRQYCDDVDMQGRNLHTFASEVLWEALAYGMCGVLVEYPQASQLATLDDERRAGVRPYFVAIKHSDILGWRQERINGAMQLTQLRIAEAAEVPDGPYGVTVVQRVRVLTPGAWELWQASDGKGQYELIDEGANSLGSIPFVPFFGHRTGYMEGVSPLLDLAHLNVKHWQQQSDQDDSARFARKRLLVFVGMEGEDKIIAAANYAVQLPAGASAMVVQGSAESVTVGRSELEALEAQMIQTGAELLVSKPGQRSATEANNDAEANKSDLQRIVEGFEDSLDAALAYMAEWIGLPTGGMVSLYKDFGAATLGEASGQLVLAMQQGGLLTKETAIREQQRRGLINAELDPAAELEAVGEEGPALGAM